MSRARLKRTALPSGLQIEVQRSRALLELYFTHQLNRLFELSSAGASRRRLRIPLYVLVVAAISFAAHALMQFQFRGELASTAGLDSLLSLGLVTALRILLVFGIASAFGLHMAGGFLADVFELQDPRLAWRYVADLASGRGQEVIHLREGRIADVDRESPIVQIGGPGRVFVDFDTAALFEKPDGTPHVIGALDGANGAFAGSTTGITLEGFERLREPLVNLRDQYIGNPSGEPLRVVGRSLDGVPISVRDVRGVFSVRRAAPHTDRPDAVARPFLFRARDIENLIYGQYVPVLTSGEYPSGLPGDWAASMQVLIRESLREFMSQNRLAEYFAGVGVNETESSEYRADTLLSRTLQVATAAPEAVPPTAASTPRLRPRTELSSQFKKYGSEFSTKAQEIGLELHWIGVGTWKMPDEASEMAISEKHLEAWRLNRENAQRSDPAALDQIAESALVESKLRLIRDVPIARHEKNLARYSDKGVLLECMLQDFWDQLGEALDIHYRNGTATEDLHDLEQAVLIVEGLLKISHVGHVLGGTSMSRVRQPAEWSTSRNAPPAPASRAEATKYQLLLGKLQGDYRVAEAMIANEGRRHSELGREQLIARIVERFERHGR